MTSFKDSQFVKHESCPRCQSSDALARYSDGHAHCFAVGCGYRESSKGEVMTEAAPAVTIKRPLEVAGVVADIPDRRISAKTCRKFNVTVEYSSDGSISKHHYPYYSTDTDDVKGSKVRLVQNKNFFATGTLQGTGLFGQQTCRGKGKYITITEGELDALSVSEIFENKWDVVSLRSGASSAAKEIKEQLEWLEGYENVVLCFDGDKAGQAAIDEVKDVFSPGKLKICKLPLKDASEMLQSGKVREFVSAWWDAKPYQPDGIVSGNDTWEAITGKMKVKSIAYPWQGLNDMTKGFRPYELVTITSGSGMGKSQMIRELEYYFLNATEDNIGILALEEDVARTALGIMSVAADCPLHLEEDLDEQLAFPYWEETLGTGRYYLFDHWGSTSEDNLLARVRYMAKALDCKWIVLDHLSIVVSAQDNGDERKAIDGIMTKLRALVQETGVGLFLVSHLRRTQGKPHEDGGRISLGELRGSQAIAQLSDMVIGLERNQQHEDPEIRNTTTVRILKNRYAGLTGAACWLKYDNFTGRMSETSKPKEHDNDL
jgi:twinkle protein